MDDQVTSTMEAVLEAVEALGDDLSSRNPDDMSFQVKVPAEPPAVRVLAELINELQNSLGRHHERLSTEMQVKTNALSEAYNALQAQNEEVQRELIMARNIQSRLLPGEEEFPQRDELSCAGFYQSMANVGGDLYDILRIGRNSYGLLMADVSGHGIPAALITALVKIAFQSRAAWGVDPGTICAQVNAELYPILSGLDFFVTAWFGIVDLERGVLSYANCGHHPSLLIRSDADEPVGLDTRGKFLGVFDEPKIVAKELALQPGDTIFMYTDGIIEARNFFDEEYGYERMLSCLQGMGDSTVEGVVRQVRIDMQDFCMGADQRDDQSMFAVRYNCAMDSGELGGFHSAQAASDSLLGDSRTSAVRQNLAKLLPLIRQKVSEGDLVRAMGMVDTLMILLPGNKSVQELKNRLESLHA